MACRSCGSKMRKMTTMERSNMVRYFCEKCGFIEERITDNKQSYGVKKEK